MGKWWMRRIVWKKIEILKSIYNKFNPIAKMTTLYDVNGKETNYRLWLNNKINHAATYIITKRVFVQGTEFDDRTQYQELIVGSAPDPLNIVAEGQHLYIYLTSLRELSKMS